jgi:hypothetical protein
MLPLVRGLGLYGLDENGHGAHTRLRSLRRKLYLDDVIDHQDMVAFSSDVQHRHVLIGWFEESGSEGVRGRRDLVPRVSKYDPVERGTTWVKIDGRAIAAVLDLANGEALRLAEINYTTNQLYVTGHELRVELDRIRAAAAVRLADQSGER